MKSRGVVSKARTSSGRGRELETRLLGAAAVGRSDARLQDVVRSPSSRRDSATLHPARLVLGTELPLHRADADGLRYWRVRGRILLHVVVIAGAGSCAELTELHRRGEVLWMVVPAMRCRPARLLRRVYVLESSSRKALSIASSAYSAPTLAPRSATWFLAPAGSIRTASSPYPRMSACSPLLSLIIPTAALLASVPCEHAINDLTSTTPLAS